MRFCLRCKRMSPRGSHYCISCSLAFGGSRCEHGHLTPGLGVIKACPVCRSAQLVQPTPSVNLALMSRATAWVMALLGLRWGFSHLDLIFRTAMAGLSWILGHSLMGSLSSLLSLAIALRIFVWCVGLFDPEGAKRLEPLTKLLPWLLKVFGKAAIEIAHLTFKLVEGRSFRPKEKKKEKEKVV